MCSISRHIVRKDVSEILPFTGHRECRMETAIKLPNGKVITKKDNKELNELQKMGRCGEL